VALHSVPDQTFPTAQGTRALSARALTRTHPLYDKFLSAWVMYLDLYEGENLERYIHRHARESAESHAMRAKRIVYRNFCAPVIDLYLHYIFSKHISRTPVPGAPAAVPTGGIEGEWVEFQKNVDRRQNTIDRYMVQVARYALIFGHVFIAVDMPTVRQPPRHEAERKQRGLRPYFVTYFPTEVPNWALDEDERLLWIRFREPLPDAADPYLVKDRDTRYAIDEDPLLAYPASHRRLGRRPHRARYRTWTRTEWAIHEVRGDTVLLVDQGVHGLGEVPVVPVYNRRSARYPFLGQSLIADIAKLNVGILNMDSMIDEAVYQQVLNILVIGRQPQDAEEIIIGTNNVLEYSGDRPPYFLSPSTAPTAFMEDRTQRLREEIYRLAKLGGGLGLEPRAAPSGVALAFEFNETNAVLAERADELENAESAAHRLWHKWLRSEWRGAIDYPDDFSVQSFLEELQMITTGGDAIRSPTFRRTLEKRAAKRILRNTEKEVLERVDQEIDFIPEIIKTFSGPIFFDPLTQDVRQPGAPGPIGAYGAMVQQQTAPPQQDETAAAPQEEPAEQAVTPDTDAA
jgi:hypothetical protein